MTGGAGELVLRDTRADERPAIRELTLRAYAEYATTMAPTAWAGLEQSLLTALGTEGAAECIVAERQGQLVGSVLLYPPAADAYGGAAQRASWPEVRLLAVAPDARGQGVGRALMEECVRRARRMGAAELGLHTSMSMRAAMQMYERMGFVRVPELDFHPDGAEVVEAYRLRLSDPAAPQRDRPEIRE